MRLLLIILVLVAGVFLGYPPLKEARDNECSALDQRFSDLTSHDATGLLRVGPLYGSSSSEPSAEAYARDRFPSLPPPLGCALAYWRSLLGQAPSAVAATARAPAPSSSSQALPATASPDTGGAIIARDITPNGDPISPAQIFTLPMDSVAVRVAHSGNKGQPAHFQLMAGRAVIQSCNAEYNARGAAWCKFTVGLRKGNYSIALTANNVLVGQFPFTVIGR
jgi:hypothetical protein